MKQNNVNVQGLPLDYQMADNIARSVAGMLEYEPTVVAWHDGIEHRMSPVIEGADVAQDAGALLVVDNTFASPYLQQPLRLGADVVLHSVTKFINGHADVVGGLLVARDDALLARLRSVMSRMIPTNAMGSPLSFFTRAVESQTGNRRPSFRTLVTSPLQLPARTISGMITLLENSGSAPISFTCFPVSSPAE